MDDKNPEFRFTGSRMKIAKPIEKTTKVYVVWTSGEEAVVEMNENLSGLRLATWGSTLEWGDEIDIGSDTLRQMAEEQNAVIHRRKAG